MCCGVFHYVGHHTQHLLAVSTQKMQIPRIKVHDELALDINMNQDSKTF